MRSDIVPGGAFPDYELPDHTGNLRKLSELRGDDPLILTLARGRSPRRSSRCEKRCVFLEEESSC
jgi:peroxiredoxin